MPVELWDAQTHLPIAKAYVPLIALIPELPNNSSLPNTSKICDVEFYPFDYDFALTQDAEDMHIANKCDSLGKLHVRLSHIWRRNDFSLLTSKSRPAMGWKSYFAGQVQSQVQWISNVTDTADEGCVLSDYHDRLLAQSRHDVRVRTKSVAVKV